VSRPNGLGAVVPVFLVDDIEHAFSSVTATAAAQNDIA
jgi:hypothetical protein